MAPHAGFPMRGIIPQRPQSLSYWAERRHAIIRQTPMAKTIVSGAFCGFAAWLVNGCAGTVLSPAKLFASPWAVSPARSQKVQYFRAIELRRWFYSFGKKVGGCFFWLDDMICVTTHLTEGRCVN
jgi:hypothetical protein